MGTTQNAFSLTRRIGTGIVLAVAPVALMYGGLAAANSDHSAADVHASHHSHIVGNSQWVPR